MGAFIGTSTESQAASYSYIRFRLRSFQSPVGHKGYYNFITTHCQFDGTNNWPGVINGDEVSKSRISPFIVEIITKHPKLDVHLLHTRMSSNSSGQNKNKIKGMAINVNFK